MTNTIQNPIHWFRHCAPYINTHRGKIFVIAFEGQAVNHPNFSALVHDIALLHSLGIRLVIVHGSRPQIDATLLNAGIKSQFHLGLRITPHHTLPYILAAVGATRLQIEAEFSKGLVNSPMFGAKIATISGNFVTAKPFGVRDGIDFGLTGEIHKIDKNAIHYNLQNNHIVILGSAGFSVTGEVFNLEALDIATKTAITLNADKLILLGDDEGVIVQGNLIKELTAKNAKNYVQTHPKLTHAITACTNGVNRVHLLSHAKDGAILQELFTTDGGGTMVTQSDYDQIRHATESDIMGIMSLIRPLEEQGVLVARSRERLESEIHYFNVIERDGKIIGCAALYPLDEDCAEIASIAIDPEYQNGSRGTDLLHYLEDRAKSQHQYKIFALTTRTLHWFLSHGFYETTYTALPPKRQAMWHNGRNSKVLLKELNQ